MDREERTGMRQTATSNSEWKGVCRRLTVFCFLEFSVALSMEKCLVPDEDLRGITEWELY